ncbi:conjugal transfer protein TraB, partial [Escherichia coli]|nr:conjugal transfer protein TraB [Escherichia coli]
AEQTDGIQIVGDDGDGAADAGTTASGTATAGAVRTVSAKAAEIPETFLPMGAIVTGLAINGGDFPTTRSAQRNPVPMLIRVKKDAILPNNQRASVKECFLMVSGNGELSTGRAQLRAERISCVLKNKRVVEVAVDGYVV